MNIFRRRKKGGRIQDTNTERVVYDLNLRAPFWSYVPVDYQEYEPFVKYGVIIDEYLAIQVTGSLDSGNGNTLDNDITDMKNRSLSDLDSQQADHNRIMDILWQRRCGDVKSYKIRLEQVNEELENNRLKLETAQRRFQNGKFMFETKKGGEKYE